VDISAKAIQVITEDNSTQFPIQLRSLGARMYEQPQQQVTVWGVVFHPFVLAIAIPALLLLLLLCLVNVVGM